MYTKSKHKQQQHPNPNRHQHQPNEHQKEPINYQYHIPKNRCQLCYSAIGQYILDCYCILCQKCYGTIDKRSPNCNLCGNKTKGNCINAKNESSINKISHLFGNVENSLNRTVEVFKFQNSIANKYCRHLQNKLKNYQKAVDDLIGANPHLQQYFRHRLNKDLKTQQYSKSNPHLASTSTTKPNLEPSLNTFDQCSMHHKVKQYGGSGVYKVSNLNYSTALRSSKRSNRIEDEDSNIYQKYNRK